MSAFVVHSDHVDALVTAGLRRASMGPMAWYWQGVRYELDELQTDNPTQVGRMLLAENIASVNARYPGDAADVAPAADPEVLAYRFRRVNADCIPAVVALKLLACYEYQACEHDGWEASKAHAFCQALRHNLIERLAGYTDAPWAFTRAGYAEHVAQVKAKIAARHPVTLRTDETA